MVEAAAARAAAAAAARLVVVEVEEVVEVVVEVVVVSMDAPGGLPARCSFPLEKVVLMGEISRHCCPREEDSAQKETLHPKKKIRPY